MLSNSIIPFSNITLAIKYIIQKVIRLLPLTLTILFSIPLKAQTFPCDNAARLYFFQVDTNGGNALLSCVTGYSSSTPVITPLFKMPIKKYNAIGANPIDNYLYCISDTFLVRIDAAGNATTVCNLGFTSVYACFDPWGRFWTTNGNNLVAIDVNNCSIVKGPYSLGGAPSAGFLDMVFNPYDCFLYFGRSRCDTSGVIDTSYTTPWFPGLVTYGGAAIGSDGNIYGIGGSKKGGLLSVIDMPSQVSDSVCAINPPPAFSKNDMASFICLTPAKASFSFIQVPCTYNASFADQSTGQIAGSWHWDFGDPASGMNNISFESNPAHIFSSPGTYTVTLAVSAAVNGCFRITKDTTAIVITVNDFIRSASVTGTPVICNGSCDGSAVVTVASGGGAPYSYSWSTVPSQNGSAVSGLCAGNYEITVTDSHGCVATAITAITEPPPLSANLSLPVNICMNQCTTLVTNANGGIPGYTFNWMPGNFTSKDIQVCPSVTTTYTLIVADMNNCKDSAVTSVTVNPLPEACFSADVLSGCVPLCVNFTDCTQGSGIKSAVWNFGDGNTSSVLNPLNCFTLPGVYSVSLIVTDINNCSDSITKNNYIETYALPVAAFTMSNTNASIINPEICFSNSSSGAVSYNWAFGDPEDGNGKSAEMNPCYMYHDTGSYCVTLTAISEHGCEDTSVLCLVIYAECAIYAPNTFTPNGDGLNEKFNVKGVGLDETTFQLYIFDRWGEQIFESSNSSEGWDGKANKGKQTAEIDTYVWKVSCYDVLGERHSFIGHVNLLR